MQECLLEGEEPVGPEKKSSRESVAQTWLVALLVALVCSTVVSSTVYLLRPIQLGYQLLDRNRAVVVAAGLAGPDAGDREVVTRFVELDSPVIDLDEAEFAEDVDGRTYDHWNTTDRHYVAHPIPADRDDAGLGVRPRLVPVFVRRGDGAIARLVLPVHGRGMWSTLYGYVALAADLNTVERLVIHRHGETPGIGDRIEDPAWLGAWRGKRLYDADGQLAIRVLRGRRPGSVHEIDLISGASVTSTAVGNMVRYWMGEDAYGPWLRRLRSDAVAMQELLEE